MLLISSFPEAETCNIAMLIGELNVLAIFMGNSEINPNKDFLEERLFFDNVLKIRKFSG